MHGTLEEDVGYSLGAMRLAKPLKTEPGPTIKDFQTSSGGEASKNEKASAWFEIWPQKIADAESENRPLSNGDSR